MTPSSPNNGSGALSFWSAGGDVICRGGVVVDDAMGRDLLAVFSDEIVAANRALDHRAGLNAARLARQLTNARIAARQWRRAGEPA